ncbi:biopolymer transporter Tol (plasmid) [Agrobacterium leguminum]|uniref:Periplasmic component of the Tol biopolymer transport system n=1 Tax=Agrobacterium deltaense NCPPB 1641 TaxID=1183425 RepID=A0A1S7UBB4_9HYPH|nr:MULTISPECIES: biopolymer transporter Tol [Agrobacterium]WFS69774.1 biopolymer transporter Tol [Agrobacterium leguminum]CVI64089.1 Periplasmic component of the Tol biopolymer transport system [Agrobacterium deltaense NCPPB 1641]
MKIPPRELAGGQRCQVWIHDTITGENRMILETTDLLLEAPNWTLQDDALILNGKGLLWRLPLDEPRLKVIDLQGVPPLNNDHVLDPDGAHIFVSTYDNWQLYRASLSGGKAVQISGKEGPDGLLHFLHGVSPDGRQLAFVGVQARATDDSFTFLSAEICTVGSDGRGFRQITSGGAPADGPEYSPDGAWIYCNTEAFSGHAQIARMRPDGSEIERLTHAPTVDWFPHLSPDCELAAYLAYPPGTKGHPADLWVELKLVRDGDWSAATTVARIFGGQGTINVNSWSPDSRRFAFVAYPMD